jgi:hypothetical protein
MNREPTIPCPICNAPIFVRQIDLPTGDIVRVYADPLSIDDEVYAFHRHQLGDVEIATMH